MSPWDNKDYLNYNLLDRHNLLLLSYYMCIRFEHIIDMKHNNVIN